MQDELRVVLYMLLAKLPLKRGLTRQFLLPDGSVGSHPKGPLVRQL